MRAVERAGGEPGRVRVVDVDEPRPGPGTAVVAVRAFSLNRDELSLLEERPDGWRPGQDVAGEVVAPAQDGTGPPAGARVVVRLDGAGWAERVAAEVGRLAPLPAGVPTTAAATLPVAGLAALRALRMGGPLLGVPVAVTGASGAVGRFAVELAAGAGARVTAVSRRGGDDLRALGAAHVVADVADAPAGVALVVETTGGAAVAAAARRCRPGGTVVLLAAGPPSLIGLDDFGGHGVSVTGFFSPLAGARDDDDLATLVDLVARDRLHPGVGRTADWSELPAVLDDLREHRVGVKAVLTIGA